MKNKCFLTSLLNASNGKTKSTIDTIKTVNQYFFFLFMFCLYSHINQYAFRYEKKEQKEGQNF